ncbi:hypothetical protein [Deinococcus cellulosilyticus]|uniref:Uncharacterized protein n=1 Tax=Deinococcus cellulosilyticus (strain DSM 18568 / NBRC 106333 / KACC 11606 / 5516J-15) TaxID=1223518 RepID=A0A511MYG5_DEIC1|nr:hypothetical protein [Deinococcus cellulosilyticus]GEM45634.1 hypothetical protein DC3_12690 [Deinococcus cellulosilyticus NBRC 106333 = KACC 11606]
MKTIFFTTEKLNPIQRFYRYLQLSWNVPLVIPYPLRDTHWSGTLKALASFISMTVDVKRHRLIQVLGTGIFIRDLRTGEILQKTEPLWASRTAYHQDDLVVFSGEHTTVVHPEPWKSSGRTPGVPGCPGTVPQPSPILNRWPMTPFQGISSRRGQLQNAT